MEKCSLKKLLPRGEYYGKTEKIFKDACKMATNAGALCTQKIRDKTDLDKQASLTPWKSVFDVKNIKEVRSRLATRGGSSFSYIQKIARSLQEDVEIEIEDVFIVKVKNVNWHPQVFGGSLYPVVSPEVEYLQRIKPAYMVFKYYDKKGRRVYSGV